MSSPQLPKNFDRAIDLSALAAPKVAAGGDFGLPVTAENMVAQFLAPSQTQVVILLCWSARSTQSQQIAQMLSKFHALDSANPDQAQWIFGSVNVDAEPAIAKALQVQSVPLALAIIQEQPVPLFESVPTEEQVRQVIDKVLSIAAERGVGKAPVESAPIETKLEPEEEAAIAALEVGDFAVAKLSYEAWLKREPFEPLAKLGLAQTELFIRTAGVDVAAAISLANEDRLHIANNLLAADLELLEGKNQIAFDRLITLVKNTSDDDRKLVREHLLTLFTLVDPDDPILLKARQLLASALF